MDRTPGKCSLVAAFGEVGDEPEYEAIIAADPCGNFSVGRCPWVFWDLSWVEPVSINGRQGVWTLPVPSSSAHPIDS